MNTRFDVGDKAYCEVTIIGISINEDGLRYLVRADKDTFITTDEHLMKADVMPFDDTTKELLIWMPAKENWWKIKKAIEAIMNGVGCAEIASALDMTPEEVEDLKTQLDDKRGGKTYE